MNVPKACKILYGAVRFPVQAVQAAPMDRE